jgi:hypothetical protein
MRRVDFLVAFLSVAGITWLVPGRGSAQTSYPMIMSVEPVAVQRGQTIELRFSGRESFEGAWSLLCQPPGLRGEVLKVETVEPPQTKARARGRRRALSQVRARLHVAPEAPLGPREVRVVTTHGASTVGLVVVVDAPVVAEADDLANDRPEAAQKLVLPAVVAGRIGKVEDVDWYSFDAAKGDWVAFEVWGNRLENKMHDLQTHLDPILIVSDANGRELAAADNTLLADPMLAFQAPAAGTYYLQVRDTNYSGNAFWTYALHAVTGPAATSVFPLAVNPGTTAQLEVTATGPGSARSAALDVPRDIEPGPHLFAIPQTHGPSLPVPLVVTGLPVSVERSDAPACGMSEKIVTLPVALSGRLGDRGDSDGFCFPARKGGIYSFEVVARRAGSECDPVLKLLDPKGATLTRVDDTRGLGKDIRIEWKAPADGTYVLQVSDLHDRGGASFGYVLLAEAGQPDFELTCDPDKINVGPGGRVPLFVRVARRHGFEGAVSSSWEGLPTGVSASPLTIAPSMKEGVIVVSAEPAAKPAASLVTLKGTAQTPAGPIVRTATPEEEIYLPGGGRGRYRVETLALSVTEPSDITVEAAPREIILPPGGSATIDVNVARSPAYANPVNLAIVLQHLGGVHANPLPAGVTVKEAGSKTLLGPKESKGKIILQAAANALPCDKVPITVMGHVSINFVVKTAYASAPILLTIRRGGKAGS